MKRIRLTNGKYALVDDGDYPALSQHTWYSQPPGYASRCYRLNGKQKRVMMHRDILKPARMAHTDHVNGNGLDNRRANIRLCNRSENMRNRKIHKNNTSGIKGVRQKLDGAWEARIQVNNKPFGLGTYSTKHDAMIAYDAAAFVLHGAFARPNKRR